MIVRARRPPSLKAVLIFILSLASLSRDASAAVSGPPAATVARRPAAPSSEEHRRASTNVLDPQQQQRQRHELEGGQQQWYDAAQERLASEDGGAMGLEVAERSAQHRGQQHTQQRQLTTIPLRRRSRLERRTSQDALRAWAVREKARMALKYAAAASSSSALLRRGLPVEEERSDHEEHRVRVERRKDYRGEMERRQIATRLSTAGFEPTSRASTTASAAQATATGESASGTNSSATFVGDVELFNYESDLEYFATIGLGAPAQFMNVILDTGSADLWIAADNCTAENGCEDIPKYYANVSDSAMDTGTSFDIQYGHGGFAAGDLWRDYVSLGGYNVSHQGFGLVDELSVDLLSANVSGLLGMGWSSLAASGATPFWQNLWQADVLPFPGFAFSLSRYGNVSNADTIEDGGSLTIGYLNVSLFHGPIHWVPIPDAMQSYWLIPMDALAVNGTNVTATAASDNDKPLVAIDTGTTLIGGPAEDVANLYSLIPGAEAATGAYAGYYSFPCDSQPNITFTFGDTVYNMTNDDFNIGPFGISGNVSTCLGAFFHIDLGSSSRVSWVVGSSFLKNVYSVYRADPPSVGFAPPVLGGQSDFSQGYNVSSGEFINSTYGDNVTAIPPGVFGASGTTSLRTSVFADGQSPTNANDQKTATASNIPSENGSASTSSLLVVVTTTLAAGFALVALL